MRAMKIWFKRLFLIFGIVFIGLILFSSYWLVFGNGRYFFYLPYASKLALKIGAMEKADLYAKELLLKAENEKEEPRNWNYGNAIHHSHTILGQVALRLGDIDASKIHLIKSGETIGSPQLDTFGPNMALAKELLESGELEAVLRYLNLCKLFWKMDYGKLDRWKTEIMQGKVPDFGLNLRSHLKPLSHMG
jgi:hypothetical protein